MPKVFFQTVNVCVKGADGEEGSNIYSFPALDPGKAHDQNLEEPSLSFIYATLCLFLLLSLFVD